ncbi:MAG: hypothetical protein COU07_01925 [Candidatus Harrisonbacteria bacterium CG10_big_fil_rev_8_21_14_0_10_40_38]|uniref:Uncharacterized protein n=1 Tax=Candidatus Harrisonbacteria bacterium CG10_big_fil_rev_8_21_14_0_10_40_38 TaxID=1974583 RepID=A0A2H0UT82_9BACT|nr:MAG: hypothetical protein COU07_01925 [Candidatus Harrisonbacteria bacterium CG10_big_fil_rev_8_21_14_0_10_40_38]
MRNTFSLGALLFSKIAFFIKIDYSLGISFANSELVAAKEKLEIVISAAPPQILIFFAGGFFRRNAFGLIQECCIKKAPRVAYRGAGVGCSSRLVCLLQTKIPC